MNIQLRRVDDAFNMEAEVPFILMKFASKDNSRDLPAAHAVVVATNDTNNTTKYFFTNISLLPIEITY